jgi:type II secretory pathway pseudopilin PulG
MLSEQHQAKNINLQSGFSLVEVLVSLSIFIVVVTISVGALMALIGANARARNTQAAMTNISYALDSMTREIRTGTDYYCGGIPALSTDVRDCIGSNIFFFNEGGKSLTGSLGTSRRIGYRLFGNKIQRRLGTGGWSDLTAPEITISRLHFYTTGTSRNDAGFLPPLVSIYIEGTAGSEANERGNFNVQTTVTQQLLDI